MSRRDISGGKSSLGVDRANVGSGYAPLRLWINIIAARESRAQRLAVDVVALDTDI
jgi:hypothetical protein